MEPESIVLSIRLTGLNSRLRREYKNNFCLRISKRRLPLCGTEIIYIRFYRASLALQRLKQFPSAHKRAQTTAMRYQNYLIPILSSILSSSTIKNNFCLRISERRLPLCGTKIIYIRFYRASRKISKTYYTTISSQIKVSISESEYKGR